VQFADLGLVVVDEQHRFGVEQRAALAAKSATESTRPHVLVMTATPIPRTVAMTVFGDLEVSTCASCRPAGNRSPPTSCPPERPGYLGRAWQRHVRRSPAGGRSTWSAPGSAGTTGPTPGRRRLARTTTAEARGAAARERRRSTSPDCWPRGSWPGCGSGCLHGRMPAEEKDDVMRRFADPGPDGIDVLVATTVIEVGVDVPNATVMVVMDADRFGVSQLHQLRGRVGRGARPGCACS
jgi:ATP-dependent DNA helicase RecG